VVACLTTLVSSSDCLALKLIFNEELDRMWREIIVAEFRVLSQRMTRENEENEQDASLASLFSSWLLFEYSKNLHFFIFP
jgi:hypothetical protein